MHISGEENLPSRSLNSKESRLIQEAKKDIKAFEHLYNTYYEAILRFVYQRVETKEEAYDITSQVFLKAMQNLATYEDRGFPFSSWLYRIAKSEVYQYLRNQNKQEFLAVSDKQLEGLVGEVNQEEGVRCTNEDLIDWLEQIPQEEVVFIEMRYLEQRSFKEIGEILDITENNAKVKTHRILEKWKNKVAS